MMGWFGRKSAPADVRPCVPNWQTGWLHNDAAEEGFACSYEARYREVFERNPVGQRSVRLVAGMLGALTIDCLEGDPRAVELIQADGLLENIAANLLLHGNAYVRLLADDHDRPAELCLLRPERVDIEITEGVFVSNTRAVMQGLQKLRDGGVSIALDDFGTGYSSLSYLSRLPVDKIKIDQSFVKRLPADQEAGAIIRAVMTLSETLGKVVIAEGVETADQAWMLRMMGCKIGQGFHYGRPMSGAEMRAPMTVRRLASG